MNVEREWCEKHGAVVPVVAGRTTHYHVCPYCGVPTNRELANRIRNAVQKIDAVANRLVECADALAKQDSAQPVDIPESMREVIEVAKRAISIVHPALSEEYEKRIARAEHDLSEAYSGKWVFTAAREIYDFLALSAVLTYCNGDEYFQHYIAPLANVLRKYSAPASGQKECVWKYDAEAGAAETTCGHTIRVHPDDPPTYCRECAAPVWWENEGYPIQEASDE